MQPSSTTVSLATTAVSTGGILFVGVGRAGTNLVRSLAAAGLTGGRFVCVNTQVGLPGADGVSEVTFGARVTRGFGCGGDLQHGRLAAEQDAPALRELFTGARLVVLLTGLGAGTGSGATPVLAKLARDQGALVLAVATSPFAFEPAPRQAAARTALTALKGAADVVLCLSNAAAARMLDEKTLLPEVLAHANAIITENLRGLWRLLTRPGLISVGVADLERLLRGLHGESAFATVEGHGEHRAREAFDRLVGHPLLQAQSALSEAEAVLVNLATGGDLRLDELEWLQRQFQNHCERARLVLGASDDPALRGRLEITVVAVRPSVAPVPAAPADQEEPVPAAPRLPSARREAPPAFEGLELAPEAAPRAASRPDPLAGEPPAAAPRRSLGKTVFGKRKVEQQTFNFDPVSRGRFEHTESTMYRNENLDEPTFLRKGVTLN